MSLVKHSNTKHRKSLKCYQCGDIVPDKKEMEAHMKKKHAKKHIWIQKNLSLTQQRRFLVLALKMLSATSATPFLPKNWHLESISSQHCKIK